MNVTGEKTNEIFDVKVQTRDVQFDNNFNLYLPRKIWEKWQKFDIDEENVNNWLKIKKKIVEIGENGARINPEIKGLKEVKFYRNFSWKRVFILHNDSNYLFANKIKYFNWNLLTKEIFEKLCEDNDITWNDKIIITSCFRKNRVDLTVFSY